MVPCGVHGPPQVFSRLFNLGSQRVSAKCSLPPTEPVRRRCRIVAPHSSEGSESGAGSARKLAREKGGASPSPVWPRFQSFDHSRNRRLFASRDRELLTDGGELAVTRRILAKPLVPVDDRRQFPARPLKDIDDALGLVEVVMKVFQQRFEHRPTPHPRGLLRGVADALLDEDPLDDVDADLAPSSK
jgi:hypothetical protein